MSFLDIEYRTDEELHWEKIPCTTRTNVVACCEQQHWTLPDFYQKVWAIVLNRFTASQSVTFAINDEGDRRPSKRCEIMFNIEVSVAELMKSPDALSSSIETTSGLDCATAVVVDMRDGTTLGGEDFVSPLQIVLCIERCGVSLFYCKSIPSWHAKNLASALDKAVEEISRFPRQTVKDLDLLSESNNIQVGEWQDRPRARSLTPMVNAIRQHASLRPTHQAICAWDGTFTYAELDNISSRLAHRLRSMNVGENDMVLLGFEKSAFALVAMVSILKAGAIFVPISPTYPTPRIQAIVDATNPKLAFTSKI
ncbi:uncharacterized protein N7506_011817 [Penicillium brevicompactum]|uniref:uncharacterized protein n=1 Tax=Penicillium brevicompactum TaxID=5074 RepID=UPI0025418E6D|nr:uncharacterized protein N7506_011817 [Penicillium brevicompactum]KAJ5319113.1 hypothetical protein N7506_011817 [Penicillium brevicompactum]